MGVWTTMTVLEMEIPMADPENFSTGWPALMSTEMAARYLSVDEQTLLRLVDQFHNPAIEIEGLSIRWRKQDLDRLIKKLPLVSPSVREADRPRLLKLDSSQLDKLAEQVARRIECAQPNTISKLVSINDACAILGLGRTSVYRMIKDGTLQVRRIGRRTLLLKEEIEAILDGSDRA